MSNGERVEQREHAGADRRKVDVSLTLLTTALFLGFLWIMIADPRALSADAILACGFGLIAYSVAATWLYEIWINRTLARDGSQ